MKLFRYRWFDRCEWSWMECEMVASSQKIAESYLRENEYVDFRPYNRHTEEKDSLELVCQEDIKMPYFINGPKRE